MTAHAHTRFTRLSPSLVALLLAVSASRVFALTSGNYTYTVTSGKATITGFNSSYAGPLSIPSTLGGYPVTAINSSAFENCTSLTSVTIPDSVTCIGKYYVFLNCTALAAINVSPSNPNFASFDGVLFNKNLTTLIQCPEGRSGSYTIPDSVTAIGNSAFSGCDFLTSVTIPDSVTSIGTSVFYYCTSLTSVTIPDSITSISTSAFENCTSLTSVTIPDSVTSIGNYAFSGCIALTSVTIGNSVTSIGSLAFCFCRSLTFVIIPDSVTSIGGSAFVNCTALTSVLFTGDAPTTIDSTAFYSPTTIYYFPDTTGWSSTVAGRPAKPLLTYTNVNDRITITGIGASYTGYYLPIPATIAGLPVTAIGNSAFSRCMSLTSITIPDSVTDIGWEAFAYSISLTSVTIGNSVTNIGNSAFSGCSSLTVINVDPANQSYASTNGVLFDKNLTTLIHFPSAFSGPYTIPNGVTEIGQSIFSGCSALTSVTIPDSVTNINDYAFSSCTSLTSVTIGNGVTAIGAWAFSYCPSLASVNIGNSVTSIVEFAFYYCESLTSVTIPDSVTSIGAWAFSSCTSLTSVTIGNGVTAIGGGVFSWCEFLTSVLFTGDAPTVNAYAFDSSPVTIYHLPNASGWDTPVNGLTPISWNPTFSPTSTLRFTPGQFAFTLTGNANIPVTVKATTNLATGVWIPITNATLNASGALDFSDPDSSSHDSRFYRVTFPQ